jgi:CHAT domain
VDSQGAIVEMLADGQRGWGYILGEDFVMPPSVVRAGNGSALVRVLGSSRWAHATWRIDGSTLTLLDLKPVDRGGLLARLDLTGRRPAGPPQDESISTLWTQVLSGALTVAEAERRAGLLTAGEDVTDEVLLETAHLATLAALRHHTREAMLLARLVVAASQAPAVGAAPRTRAVVACEFLEVAREYLVQVPDPELLRVARASGEAALACGIEQGDAYIVEAAPFRLGTLYLDPYSSTRNTATYWIQHDRWLRRGMGALDLRTKAAGQDLRTFMPLPVEALRTAETYLRQAVVVRSGKYRGVALKALAQCLSFLRFLGENVPNAELEAVALESLSLLPEEWEEARLYVWKFLSAEAKSALPAPPVPVGSTAGQRNESAALATAALAAAGHQAAAATELVIKRRALFSRQEDPDWGNQLLLEIRVAISNALVPARVRQEAWPEDPDAQASLRTRLAAGEEAPAVRCALLLQIALYATATGIGPDQALLCVDDAGLLDPDYLGIPQDAITYLRALLWHDRAGNLRKCDEAHLDAVALVTDYATATNLFHRAGVAHQAVVDLDLLTPFIPRLATDDCAEVVASLAQTTLGLSDRADAEADRVVQAYYAIMLGHTLSIGTTHGRMMFTCQLAKGARLASALAVGWHSGLKVPPELQIRLQQADDDEAALSDAGVDEEPTEVQDWLLTSYADTVEAGPTDTPLRQLRGRQRQLDQAWNRLLPQPGKSIIRSLAGVQDLLEEHMMLLIMLPAVWQTGTWGTSWLLVTRDAAHGQFVDSHFPFGDLSVEFFGRIMRSSPDIALVVDLRLGLQDDAAPDVATEDVLSILDGRRRLGDLWLRLEELLQEGYDHLLVAPHGPWHYLPWHLLGPPDEPLAARCAVTVLPNLALLNPGNFTDLALSRLRSRHMASFGLSYRTVNAHGLVPLPHAEQEAIEVAGIFGVPALLEEQATVAAVLDGLQHARYVHIAAHGRHNVEAAAFQSVQLAGSPGRLPAHLLSTLDLRGLRLVTLSACETALGRFDRADNLRGIPAALFLAGVRSIIGTLWEVRSSAAQVFFVALYRALTTDATVHSAYRVAQEETRRAFPSYRDWGAFVLMGGLTERYASRTKE